MARRIRTHIRSNVIGYVALFVALSGTAYAVDGPLAGQNTVGSADIIDNEVKVADIGQGAVATDEIASGQVKAADIGQGAVTSAAVLNDNLTGGDIAANSLKGADVDEGSLAGALIPGIATSGLVKSSGLVKVDDLEGGDATRKPLLTAGPFTIFGSCLDLGASGRASNVQIYSSAGPWSFDSDADGGGDERTELPAGPGNFIGFLADAGFAVTTPSLDVGDYAAAAPNRLLTGEVLAGENIMGTDCVFGVTGIG